MAYVLGIDLGTSSLKGLLVDQAGQVVAQASADYGLIHEKPGYSEQDPQEWLNACDKVFNALRKDVSDFTKELEGISFSGQMHSLVLLDENSHVLRPAILWNDTRTTAQCRRIEEVLGDKLLGITRNLALEGFTLPKILWVQEHEPDIWRDVRQLMMPKDYLGYYLTGNYFTDFSDAAGTLLLDIEKGDWSVEIAEAFDIPLAYLPGVVASSDCIGTLRKDIANQYGFEKTVTVFAGGADNACAAVGAGILSHDIGMASIGTSGVFLSYEGQETPDYQGKLHFFNHALAGDYYSMGVTLAAGHSLNWFRDTFAKEMSFNDLLAPISEIAPGSDGLLFTPYIVGERTPHVDSQIRGSFIGIDTNHTLAHFTRAVLEGITFSLKDSQQLMTDVAGKSFKRIVSVGGGAKNKDWLQMQADIFNVEIVSLTAEQGPGLGAAMLAALGSGWFKTIQECADTFVAYTDVVFPVDENVSIYQQAYDQFRSIYPNVKRITASAKIAK
ncbi:xylulokinase [Streptococcus moroccensis]|uniref:Xylulose kinase n=1 Tax=Streptococcus moroccensis TaxID=1451356 RepID=A0ABT9YPX0_9STRE|nr:xylulokinase [Streptococcus moroccensis]MDQ0222043.1 xylulokinase [Streptococcus moroccensis]